MAMGQGPGDLDGTGMTWRCLWLMLLCWAGGIAPVWSAGMVFGLAGKRLDDPNFQAAWRGCEAEARRRGDRCLHLGEPGPANVRVQDAAIQRALEDGLHGLAVSVTHSAYLAEHGLARARADGVPVVTFDSDLDAAHHALRRSYIGPDNEAFGRTLGELVRQRLPRGGKVCLMSADPHDPNLDLRLKGVRRALGQVDSAGAARLQGQGGWTEPARCPWFNGDQPERARRQMVLSLDALQVDALISVGHWPVADVAVYEAAVQGLAPRRPNAGEAVFVGIGTMTAGQVLLLRQGLLGGAVELDFDAMGRAAYLTMKRLAGGARVEDFVRTPFKVHAGAAGGTR